MWYVGSLDLVTLHRPWDSINDNAQRSDLKAWHLESGRFQVPYARCIRYVSACLTNRLDSNCTEVAPTLLTSYEHPLIFGLNLTHIRVVSAFPSHAVIHCASNHFYFNPDPAVIILSSSYIGTCLGSLGSTWGNTHPG